MKINSSQNSKRAKEKELKPATLRKGERPRSNGHLQNAKPQKDRTSERQAPPLTMLNNLLPKDKTGASQQSGLQHPHVILKNLAPKAQAVLYSLLRCSSNAKARVDC